MNAERIQALIQALLILASELGPLFIHSDHGKQTAGAAADHIAKLSTSPAPTT